MLSDSVRCLLRRAGQTGQLFAIVVTLVTVTAWFDTPAVAQITPILNINDVSLAEGNAGTTAFTFTVSLSAPAGPGGVTFDIATADGTAQDDNPPTEDNDYVANSLTGQTIPAGSSTYAFTVFVNGDTTNEPNETFFVNVTNIAGADAGDVQGQGTITNDDAPSADVSVAATLDTAGPYVAGQTITYTANLANGGPNTATNVQLAVTPTNLTVTNVSGGGCTVLPCTIASLSSGANATVTITATIGSAGAFDAAFSVSATEADGNPGNNTDAAGNDGTAGAGADLSVTKTDSPDPVVAGTVLAYTITVTNSGPSNADSVSLTDTLPAGATFVSLSSPGGWSCSTPAVGASGTVTCTHASMAVGSAAFTLTVSVNPNVVAGTVIANTATVSSVTTDPDPADNSATATTSVIAVADLAIAKTNGVTTVNPGDTVVYSIEVSNDGPSSAIGATVTDTFPPDIQGVTWTCTAAGAATCAPSGAGSINDSVVIPPGSSLTYVATGTVSMSAGPSVTNTASVTAPSVDPDPGNNSATDTDAVAPLNTATPTITATPTMTVTPTGTAPPTPSVTPTVIAPTLTPTATATLAATSIPSPTLAATATATGTPSPVPQPEDKEDAPKPKTEDQRQQEQHTNTGNRDDVHTEGYVVGVERAADGLSLLITIALGPGGQERLIVQAPCPDGICPDVQAGDEIEADGYQNGVGDANTYFVAADDLTVTRNGRPIR